VKDSLNALTNGMERIPFLTGYWRLYGAANEVVRIPAILFETGAMSHDVIHVKQCKKMVGHFLLKNFQIPYFSACPNIYYLIIFNIFFAALIPTFKS
jgi:hypothetical protein